MHGLDEALFGAVVAERAAKRVDAGRDRAFRDDAAGPDGFDDLVFRDDAVVVADKQGQKVEHLGFDGDAGPVA